MRLIASLIAALALLASPSRAAERVSVTFRASADVDDAAIRLGDLADVRSADPRLAAELRELAVGFAPIVGGKSTFATSYARARVLGLGLKVGDVRFIGPGMVAVSRPAQIVAADSIVSVAKAAVERVAPGSAVELSGKMPDRKTPRGSIELRAGTPRLYARSASVTVELIVAGKPVDSVNVPLLVSRKLTVVVATRTLSAGTILSASDLEIREVAESAAGYAPVTDLDLALGRQVTTTLAAGATVASGCLKTLPLIKRGDRVTLVCAGGSFSLTCTGEALSDGALGQTIRVKNIASEL